MHFKRNKLSETLETDFIPWLIKYLPLSEAWSCIIERSYQPENEIKLLYLRKALIKLRRFKLKKEWLSGFTLVTNSKLLQLRKKQRMLASKLKLPFSVHWELSDSCCSFETMDSVLCQKLPIEMRNQHSRKFRETVQEVIESSDCRARREFRKASPGVVLANQWTPFAIQLGHHDELIFGCKEPGYDGDLKFSQVS